MSIEQSSIDKLVGFLTGGLNKGDYEYLENFFAMLGEFGFVNEDFPGVPMVYAMVNGYTEKDVPYFYASGMKVPYQWAPRFYSEEERQAYAAQAKEWVIFCSEEEILTRLPKVSKRDTPEMAAMRARWANHSVAAVLRIATQLEAMRGTAHEGKLVEDHLEMFSISRGFRDILDNSQLSDLRRHQLNRFGFMNRADAFDGINISSQESYESEFEIDIRKNKDGTFDLISSSKVNPDNWLNRAVGDVSLFTQAADIDALGTYPWHGTAQIGAGLSADINVVSQALVVSSTMLKSPKRAKDSKSLGLMIRELAYRPEFDSMVELADKLAPADMPSDINVVDYVIDLTGDYKRGVPTVLGGGWNPNRGYVPLARPEKYGKLIASFFKINEDFYNSKLDILRDLVTAPEKRDDGTVWVRVAPENMDWFKTIVDSVPEEVASWEGMVYANGDGGEEIQFRTQIIGPNGPIGFTETPESD